MRAISLFVRARIPTPILSFLCPLLCPLLCPVAAIAQSPAAAHYVGNPTIRETPLLPMIFFDQGSAAIPDRYQQFDGPEESGSYIEHAAIDEADGDVAKYYEIVNIIGVRLLRHPAATITLRGDYADEPDESETLARDRVATVKSYLQRVWRIAPERIAVLAPIKSSDENDPLSAHEEARRVVIASETREILGPVRYYVIERAPALFTVVEDHEGETRSSGGSQSIVFPYRTMGSF